MTTVDNFIKDLVCAIVIMVYMAVAIILGVISPTTGISSVVLGVLAWIFLHETIGKTAGIKLGAIGLDDPIGTGRALAGMILLGAVGMFMAWRGFDGTTFQTMVLMIAALDGYTSGVTRAIPTGRTMRTMLMKGPPAASAEKPGR
jgi:hypothetical protein